MNPRERPGKRGMVFPPSWSGERFTAAEEEAQERLQEAEAHCAPADVCDLCWDDGRGDSPPYVYEACPRCGL